MRPRPQATGATEPQRRNLGQLQRRQYVRFAFYRLDPRWRALSADEQFAHKAAFAHVIQTFNRRMLLRPYTLIGVRADTDLLLWQIADDPQIFEHFAAALNRTAFAAYLTLSHSYFSQTKRSLYEIRGSNGTDDGEHIVLDPSESRYLFVYPFIKTRAWYQLSQPARQGLMDEHITVGGKYPSVRLNTTYSYGIDDYEFILGFETDEPADFLDLVQELRETSVSIYTLQDTPLFTCTNVTLERALNNLGGPAIPEPAPHQQGLSQWTDFCAEADLGEQHRYAGYVFGTAVAVFRVNDTLYAINNRCSHARGPLVDGTVDHATCSVVCPWHYGKFNLATGAAVDGVVRRPVATYETRITNGRIEVRRVQGAEEVQ